MLSVSRLYRFDGGLINECGAFNGMIGRGKPNDLEKTAPVLLYPQQIVRTCPNLGSNPGHPSEKPVSNHLSYGTSTLAKI
jgi:hypothetical protein